MTVLFDGQVEIAYSQVYLHGGEFASDFELSFGGQRNGLCGAANPGMLFLLTGLQYGSVPFRVELHAERPAVDDSWEEIVEAGFAPTSAVVLSEWGGMAEYPLVDVRPGSYRVRYCLHGMDAAHNPPEDGPAGDRYLLQLWPGPPEPDAVVKQTSVEAGCAHRAIERIPPPPTPERRAEAARRAQLVEDEASREAMRRINDQLWGDRPPSYRQRAIRGNVLGIARLDRPMADAVSELDATTQRAVARWATHRAYGEAGLADLPWVMPALAAMDAGRPLPHPFADLTSAFGRLHAETDPGGKMVATVTAGHSEELIPKIAPTFAALPALLATTATDPAQAAFDALHAAAVTYGDRHVELFDELRRAFPAVDTKGPP